MKKCSFVFPLVLSILFCGNTAYCQPACASNPAASDYCGSATHICNLNGFCGNTGSQYTTTVSSSNNTDENKTSLADVYCANIDNNSWLTFVANASSATFNIWVSNCKNDNGIQMMVLSSSDCSSFTAVSNCWDGKGNGTITASNLVVGQKYYIMIDGHRGDVCDYVIGVSSGVMVVSAGSDQTICRGKSVKLTASGADTYTWDHDQGSSSSVTVSPTATTTYTVTGSNSFGCNDADDVTVKVNQLPDVTASAVPSAICRGDVSTLTASGASQYAWDNSVGDYSFIRVSPTESTTYTVTGTDANGCSNTASATVDINYVTVDIVPYQLSPDTIKNGIIDICESASIILMGETGGSEAVTALAWSTATSQDNTLTLPLSSAGTYHVTATSVSGCIATDSMVIEVLDMPPSILIEAPEYFCNNKAFNVTAYVENGGQEPHFSWNRSALDKSTIRVDNPDSSLNAGYYSVTVSNGCHVADTSVFVDGHSIPYNQIIAPEWICTRLAYPYLQSSETRYTLLWNTGATTDSIPLPSHPTTQQTFWLTSSNGFCKYTDTADIPVYNPAPDIGNAYESCDSTITMKIVDGTQFSTYTWMVNGEFTSDYRYLEMSDTGRFTVILHVTDEHNCPATDTAHVVIHPLPIVEGMLTNLQTIANEAAVIGDSSGYSYSITDPVSGGDKEQIECIKRLKDGYYDVTIIDVSRYGCRDTSRKNVHVDIPAGLFVPNAFSPGFAAEGVRKFIPKGFNIETYALWIYDAWGNLVWYSDSIYDGHPRDAWDGYYNGKLLKGDSYVWKIKASFYNGETFDKFGNVSLVR